MNSPMPPRKIKPSVKELNLDGKKFDGFYSVASIWAEGTQMAMVAIAKLNGDIFHPLASWRSNLSAFDFGFVEVLKDWEERFSVDRAIVNESPETASSKSTRKHPIAEIIDISCSKKPSIEPFEGLVYLHYHMQQDAIDFFHYPDHARLLEQVKRIDRDPNPVVMAFLQGLVFEPSTISFGSIPVGTQVINTWR